MSKIDTHGWRYRVQSEKVRGEPRIYWVIDLTQKTALRWPGKCVSDSFLTKGEAAKELKRLADLSTVSG